MLRSLLSVAVLVCTAAISARALDESPVTVDQPLVATKYRNVSLREVALAVGKKMHRHIALEPRADDFIELGAKYGRDLSYSEFLSVLAVHGFSTYESSGVIFVVPDPNMRQLSALVVDPKHLDTPDAQWIAVLYPLATLNAAQLVSVLRPLIPQAAQLSQVQGRNVLVIGDRTSNVRRLIAVIRDMETAPALGVISRVAEPIAIAAGPLRYPDGREHAANAWRT